jgi:hypothetical protein
VYSLETGSRYVGGAAKKALTTDSRTATDSETGYETSRKTGE